MVSKNILVLGGAGYIGSHTCKKLHAERFTPITIDNLSNGHQQSVQWGPFEQLDILETDKLATLMKQYNAQAVMHFAALIEVAESVKDPESFYKNNVLGTKSVLEAMNQAGVHHIVFSSTAAVYGQPADNNPLKEDASLSPINPYGETKLEAEKLIRAEANIKSVALRYFNACGADTNGDIGEMHYPESHLIPLVIQTALNMRDQINIFGTDYNTPDGTCVRDYVHVDDLADAHINALKYLINGGENVACNLGSSNGYSVQKIIESVKNITQENFKIVEEKRRTGDSAYLVADNARAKEILNWAPQKDLETIIEDAYHWHQSDTYKNFWEKISERKKELV